MNRLFSNELVAVLHHRGHRTSDRVGAERRIQPVEDAVHCLRQCALPDRQLLVGSDVGDRSELAHLLV
jgi:hypothetical protein